MKIKVNSHKSNDKRLAKIRKLKQELKSNQALIDKLLNAATNPNMLITKSTDGTRWDRTIHKTGRRKVEYDMTDCIYNNGCFYTINRIVQESHSS